MKKKIVMALMILSPVALTLTGCSGGVAGEGSNTYSLTGGTPIVRANSFNDRGWDQINKGQHESAIKTFNFVLADNPTPAERAEAYNGLGWARTRLGSLADGAPWFEKAIGFSDDAKVGLAAAHVQKGSRADLEVAKRLIYKSLGNENPHFKYTPVRNTGMTDADVHALLAYIFAGLGMDEEAVDQIEYAKELNPDWEKTSISQLDKVVKFMAR